MFICWISFITGKVFAEFNCLSSSNIFFLYMYVILMPLDFLWCCTFFFVSFIIHIMNISPNLDFEIGVLYFPLLLADWLHLYKLPLASHRRVKRTRRCWTRAVPPQSLRIVQSTSPSLRLLLPLTRRRTQAPLQNASNRKVSAKCSRWLCAI